MTSLDIDPHLESRIYAAFFGGSENAPPFLNFTTCSSE
jgi:hypothetical protein